MMGHTDLLQLLINRSDSYEFLTHVFWQEPSPEFLRGMIVSVTANMDIMEPNEGGRILIEFIRNIHESRIQEIALTLTCEYVRLFLNAGAQPVYPYESVYTSVDGLMMQRACDEVTQEYGEDGLVLGHELKEPGDHIALEMAFMAYLCRKAYDFRQKDQETLFLLILRKQKEFFDRHLISWIPDFCHDLEQSAESDFYRGIARFTAGFLATEQELFHVLINEDCCEKIQIFV